MTDKIKIRFNELYIIKNTLVFLERKEIKYEFRKRKPTQTYCNNNGWKQKMGKKQKGKPADFGHKEGAKVLEKIVRYANKIGIEHITVYAFSTENWKEPRKKYQL